MGLSRTLPVHSISSIAAGIFSLSCCAPKWWVFLWCVPKWEFLKLSGSLIITVHFPLGGFPLSPSLRSVADSNACDCQLIGSDIFMPWFEVASNPKKITSLPPKMMTLSITPKNVTSQPLKSRDVTTCIIFSWLLCCVHNLSARRRDQYAGCLELDPERYLWATWLRS